MVSCFAAQNNNLIKCEPVLLVTFSFADELRLPVFGQRKSRYFWKLNVVLMSVLNLFRVKGNMLFQFNQFFVEEFKSTTILFC